jgi:hypothetical protein
MKTKILSNFVFLCALIPVWFLVSCDSVHAENKDIAHEEISDVPDYTVRLVNSSSLLNPDEGSWYNDISFNIAQVDGMKDKALQDKINRNILEATTHWIEDAESYHPDRVSLLPSDENCPDIYLQSDSYISMSNHFDLYNPNRFDAIIDVVTIDMKTGERVKLTDLFKVNIAFAKKILALKKDVYKFSLVTEPDILLNLLQEASLNNLELDKGLSTRVGVMMFRTSFHLRTNELHINFHREGALFLEELSQIILSLNDLEDFLLVDKW